MGIPYRGFEFSTTINAGPEKAKEMDTVFSLDLQGFCVMRTVLISR
jgi:hypothetical protein